MKIFLDIECYKNYFLVQFMTENNKFKAFDMFEGGSLNAGEILDILNGTTTVTFNGNNYDMPLLVLALNGYSCSDLKVISDKIILEDMRPYQIYKTLGWRPDFDHIDLMEVAPGQVSLKIYGGRLNSKKLQDLPIEPDELITEEMATQLRYYCRNDLKTTQDLYNALKGEVTLRENMSAKYGIDLRSKSGAQIADAVICHEVAKLTGSLIPRGSDDKSQQFCYEAPAYMRFKADNLKQLLVDSTTQPFKVTSEGKLLSPDSIHGVKVEIKGKSYTYGVGGLHSTERNAVHKSSDGYMLCDYDVTSYYPNLILNQGYYPPSIGEAFKTVYQNILDIRTEAKRKGDKATDLPLKLVLNSTFGKLNERFSSLFAPNLMVQVTLTGQLAILMLIERLEASGIEVVSANTDGILTKFRPEQYPIVQKYTKIWQELTGLNLEEARYKAIYSRDVNNYIAIYESGKVKRKGAFEKVTLSKNPQNPICNEAIVEYLVNGTQLEQTIQACQDITQFLTVRRVTGGAMFKDNVVGKAVRWYYSTETKTETLRYKKNGNKVPKSEGAKPLMELPDVLPTDIDYQAYIKDAIKSLKTLGVSYG